MKPLTRRANPMSKNQPREQVEKTNEPVEKKPQQAQCCAKLSKSVAGCHD